MNDLLMYIDQIDQSANDSELSVLESLSNVYTKSISILENYKGDDFSNFDIFQEGEKWDKFKEDTKAPVLGNKGESIIKRLLMIIPRLLRKLVDFFIRKFGKNKNNDEFCKNLDIIDKMSPEMIDKLQNDIDADEYIDLIARVELDLLDGKLTGHETRQILKRIDDKFGKDYIMIEEPMDPTKLDPKYHDRRNWDESMINELKVKYLQPGYDSRKMINFICDMCDTVRNNKNISEYFVTESAKVFKSYIRTLNSLKNDSDVTKYHSQLSGDQKIKLITELKNKMITPNLDFVRFTSFTTSLSNHLKTIASKFMSISSKQSLDDIDKVISSVTNEYGLKDGFDLTDWTKRQTTIALNELSSNLRTIQKNVIDIQKQADDIIKECEKLRNQITGDNDYTSILNYVVGRLGKLVRYTIDVSNNYDKELTESKTMINNMVKKAKKLKII